MKVLADLSVIPLGVSGSLAPHVAACERILQNAGLHPQLHANGTNVEGDWDTVFAALRRCHEAVHAMGAARIATTVRLGTRTDRDQSLDDKVRRVQAELATPPGA
jgi:uncharacterized protein (TIGR00106 family)